MIDDEVLTALRIARRPIVVDEDQLALDVVAAAGPGGAVLGQSHTRRHAREQRRTTHHEPPAVRDLAGTGRPRPLRRRGRPRHAALLEQYEPPDDLDPVVRRQLDEYCLG